MISTRLPPEWRYVAHYEAERHRMHYIEVARDTFHYGIERHTLTTPGNEPKRHWFEYEGIRYESFFMALNAKRRSAIKCPLCEAGVPLKC